MSKGQEVLIGAAITGVGLGLAVQSSIILWLGCVFGVVALLNAIFEETK